jgi:predicted PolB exonuclease-like 3'-5' exonuclease
MNHLVFDIETIPDVEFGRRLLGLSGLPDAEVAAAMFAQRRQQSGNDFLRRGDSLKLWSLGEADSTERELLERFFDGIERFTPDLVSWNGGGFDLPVMHYRCMLHGVRAARYWETGDEDTAFRYNNYLSRFHWRHLDLMDVIAGFQARGRATLADVASLLRLPGKMGFSGAEVWGAWQAGNLEGIRRYCETDVLNTYLVFLAFQQMRGQLDTAEWETERARVRDLLKGSGEPHHREFLEQWADAAQ